MAGARVLYVGVRDTSYPRHVRMVAALRGCGADVVVLKVKRPNSSVRESLHIFGHVAMSRIKWDAVVLGEFSLQLVFPAWLVSRVSRSVLVVDWFVGLVETHVEDTGHVVAGSWKAGLYRFIDRNAARLADIVVTDTEVRAKALTENYALHKPALALPVGAPSWGIGANRDSARAQKPGLRLLYYGNYVPLHGVPIVLEALYILKGSAVTFRATFVGPSQLARQYELLARELGLLDLVTFTDRVPEPQLRSMIAANDVVFGTFGTSTKAQSVIANKVWQALACDATVVTANTIALNEISNLVGDRLVRVSPATPERLAQALTDLAHHPREQTGNAERLEQHVRNHYDAFLRVLSSNL